jgi:hypothetical protein
MNDVARAAEELTKAADAGCDAMADHTFTDAHYTVYIDAAEKLIKVLVEAEGENSRFLAVILRIVADTVENL